MADMTDTAASLAQVRHVRWVPRVTALAVLSTVWLLISAAVLVLSRTAGRDGGWAWCMAALLPIVVATWFVIAPAAHRLAVTAVVAATLVLVGVGVYHTAPPSIERVDRTANSLPIPANAVLLWDEQRPSDGCVDGCSSVERYYAVPDAKGALRAFESALSAEGWRPVSARWCRDGYSVSAVPLPPDWAGFVNNPRPAAGEEVISVMTAAGC